MESADPQMCYWRCPNCGQVHFGDHPPDLCAFCRDFTTWQLIAGIAPSASLPHDEPQSFDAADDDSSGNHAHQRRLFD